jgi:hypothetical protein
MATQTQWSKLTVHRTYLLLQLCVYGMLDDQMPLKYKMMQAESLFPKGLKVAVLEPFYKTMQDGNLGVRVDNPAEVCTTMLICL